jgi:hypothetical protein
MKVRAKQLLKYKDNLYNSLTSNSKEIWIHIEQFSINGVDHNDNIRSSNGKLIYNF